MSASKTFFFSLSHRNPSLVSFGPWKKYDAAGSGVSAKSQLYKSSKGKTSAVKLKFCIIKSVSRLKV